MNVVCKTKLLYFRAISKSFASPGQLLMSLSIFPIMSIFRSLLLGPSELNLCLGVRRDGVRLRKMSPSRLEAIFIGYKLYSVGLAIVTHERVGALNVGLSFHACLSLFLDGNPVGQLEVGYVVRADRSNGVVLEHIDDRSQVIELGS